MMRMWILALLAISLIYRITASAQILDESDYYQIEVLGTAKTIDEAAKACVNYPPEGQWRIPSKTLTEALLQELRDKQAVAPNAETGSKLQEALKPLEQFHAAYGSTQTKIPILCVRVIK